MPHCFNERVSFINSILFGSFTFNDYSDSIIIPIVDGDENYILIEKRVYFNSKRIKSTMKVGLRLRARASGDP